MTEAEQAPERERRRDRSRALPLIGGAAAAAVLVAGGVFVWDRATDGYTSLTGDCEDLLPDDLPDRLPGTGDFDLRGGAADPGEDGVLQLVHCEAAVAVDGGPADFSLQAVLYDPEEREGVRRMQAMVAEGQLEREADDFELEYSDPPMRAVEWRSLPVGDGGYATVSRGQEGEDPELWTSLEYSVANLRVSLFHQTAEPVEPLDSLEALEALAEELVERLPELAGE
ncbi:hypothetical protein [Nocardiopsis valliformis]|uniref:hypothetical protein n=1 Tax=Nocardiopsis valliformis TaxID=239974 RepID=UPI0003479CD2|nr:hypothetical protein [Nocardiopsis valliformis]